MDNEIIKTENNTEDIYFHTLLYVMMPIIGCFRKKG